MCGNTGASSAGGQDSTSPTLEIRAPTTGNHRVFRQSTEDEEARLKWLVRSGVVGSVDVGEHALRAASRGAVVAGAAAGSWGKRGGALRCAAGAWVGSGVPRACVSSGGIGTVEVLVSTE